jgi:nitrate/TMAO reductase-like tetraheme cytochrome c subunit
MRRFSEWLRPAVYLGNNPTTLIGAVLTTSTAFLMLVFWAYDIMRAGPHKPYTGIVFFLILPGIFLLGLVLMPLGALIRRARLARRGELPHVYPTIDLRQPIFRRGLLLVLMASILNVAIMGTASYKAVEHMDSVQFCGQTCHSVMAPEFTAYSNSPHSRISCVECHIGAGAPWFVRSKISGTRQLFAVAFKTYSRPIPSPVESLRPARETCERCHWPERFTGDKFLVRTKYADDEANTPSTTVLLLKIGGRTSQGLVGIHGRHLNPSGERIDYAATDRQRQVIPVISYVDDAGKKVDYVSTDVKTTREQLARAEHRAMDCVDCHNRPTHAFDLPERAVDRAMSDGRINPQLPFIKKQAVGVLKADYPDRDVGSDRIVKGIIEFYRTKYPPVYQQHRVAVEAAAEQVKAIYLRNIFPTMKITWGTYVNNIGHEDFLGCFRCHDGKHKSADGKTISDDCSACHQILAMDEKDPKILADLGLK